MSHPLYEDDEQVTCMCTKCGWLGTTDAPMFLCGGCKKYLTRPIDLTDRKLKAAEAERDQLQIRVAELEKDKKVISRLGYKMGGADMRERAAKLLLDKAGRMGGISDIARHLEAAGNAILALPLDGGDGE